jgi:SAM-dependent methyltransferase
MDPRKTTDKGTAHSSTFISFRDPSGHLVLLDDRVLRVVSGDYQATAKRFLDCPLSADLIQHQLLVHTKQLTNGSAALPLADLLPVETTEQMILEHEPVAFASYPYEWAPEMLHAAGLLTLDLMDRLLVEKFGLKDATPYNVLFRGSQPIFIDFLSIEERDPLDPTWLPYAQFARNFLRPLLANKYFGLGLDQVFRVYRDGLQPDHVFRMTSLRQKFHTHFLTSVSLPTLLSRFKPTRYQKIYTPRRARSKEEAAFIIRRQLKGLKIKNDAMEPEPPRASDWASYDEKQTDVYIGAKAEFIEATIKAKRPAKVLDIGCNRGQFSLLAARLGSSVVAIDQDAVVVGRLWSEASEQKLDILPLVVDITRPTAGLGWRNRETRGFLDRALGHFDCVFMLALIHHMLVTERIPLSEILQLAWEITRDRLLIEWIDPADSMFHLLTRGNASLYEYLTRELFEKLSAKFFSIERSQELGTGGRWLYELRRREQIA